MEQMEQKPSSAPEIESLPMIKTPNHRHLRTKTPMNFKFMDLNAHYDSLRQDRIQSRSERILSIIGDHLVKLVKAEKRRIFRVFLDQGGSLDLLQLK